MRWCVAQVKPKEDEVAVVNLRRQLFNVCFPLVREHKNKETREVPMFPGYVFVEINPDTLLWISINSTRGVKRVMAHETYKPSFLPVGWVESLQASGAVMDIFLDAAAFKKGDTVEFTDGPFKGHRGVCQWSSEKRVGLLLDILGRESVVISESKALRIAQEGEPPQVR
jgi:transcriptional antiterminator RfaH